MASDSILGKRKRAVAPQRHPYLTGNFAPIQKTCPLTPCRYTGTIPDELIGGQYVRNGSNPVSDEVMGRDAHWFDGDGMLSGVLFKRNPAGGGTIEPQFVNQYILTDVFLSTISTPSLLKPILPSITTLVNPLSSLLKICLCIFRAILLVILSRFPGSKQKIKKISVANTSIMFHDGRALATCESGPPLRVQLPTLDTVGWFDGNRAEGEPDIEEKSPVLGGSGLLGFMKEWTTAHPRVDPQTNEMILFHSTFIKPYVHYSVIPATHNTWSRQQSGPKLLNAPVSGVSSAKMMHDFGVSAQHTVIMDLPLTLDPLQLAKGTPPIMYDCTKPSRFGIFPRHDPSNVRWYETTACCIFHTANTWDVFDTRGELESVDMLACRMTSATLVFSAGNIAAPQPTKETVKEVRAALSDKARHTLDDIDNFRSYERGPLLESPLTERTDLLWNPGYESSSLNTPRVEEDECRLYYYSFSMRSSGTEKPKIDHQYALSAITFEFPTVRVDLEMSRSRYVYGCTTTYGSFNSALGRAAKIDALAKLDVTALIAKGKAKPPESVTGCVDTRSVADILAQQRLREQYGTLEGDSNDAIQIFQTPPNYYAQEPRFVPSKTAAAEDAGYLLTYIFNEAQLSPSGDPPAWAVSELWVIDAQGMKDVLAKVTLPQRVPYGLHGGWFSEKQVLGQRDVVSVRSVRSKDEKGEEDTWVQRMGQETVRRVVKAIGG